MVEFTSLGPLRTHGCGKYNFNRRWRGKGLCGFAELAVARKLQSTLIYIDTMSQIKKKELQAWGAVAVTPRSWDVRDWIWLRSGGKHSAGVVAS